MKLSKKDKNRRNEKAFALGFVEGLPGGSVSFSYFEGVYYHPLIPNHSFDFSATDPNKIMLKVWQEAMKQGEKNKADEIRKALDIS